MKTYHWNLIFFLQSSKSSVVGPRQNVFAKELGSGRKSNAQAVLEKAIIEEVVGRHQHITDVDNELETEKIQLAG